MKNIKLDSVLLFTLVVPFIMTYRLSPGFTPFWFFGLIFLGLLVYFLLDLLSLSQYFIAKFKYLLLWFLIISVIGSAIYSAIIVRHKTHPVYMIHDIILQQESAVYYLLHGKNPYQVTYFNTPLVEWHYSEKEVNPALYHFVMEPFYVLFAIPFYLISNHTIGFFDGRIPLFFLFFSMLFLAGKLIKDPSKKLLFITLLAFNPAILGYTLEGRSDIFMFVFLFLGFFLLQKNKFSWAGISIALAFAIKQSAWPIFPFYLAFLYFKTKNIMKTIKHAITFAITLLVIVLPFFFWDNKAFLDSTVYYLSGNIANGYPISGYGLGMILNQIGVIKDVNQYYPFILWQAIIGIPLMFILIMFLKRSTTVSRLILVYGIFLFVFWYLSRYFNNSHLAYISTVFIVAYFWPNKETR